ncbi:MAG: hypothetical protein GC154_10645 [bacterium]|nr:hypothetical protein [bacterium]
MKREDFWLGFFLLIAVLLAVGMFTLDDHLFGSGEREVVYGNAPASSLPPRPISPVARRRMAASRSATPFLIIPYPTPTVTPTPVPWDQGKPFSQLVNRTWKSPWVNQDEFGYRTWFEDADYTVGEFTFHLDAKGGVLSLAPGESAVVSVTPGVKANGIALLCSANFLYSNSLPVEIDIQTAPNESITKHAVVDEWFSRTKTGQPGEVKFDVFVDGYKSDGYVSAAVVPYEGEVIAIRIRNDRANWRQYVMIAGIALGDNEN